MTTRDGAPAPEERGAPAARSRSDTEGRCKVCGRINIPVGRWLPEACSQWTGKDPDCWRLGYERLRAALDLADALAKRNRQEIDQLRAQNRALQGALGR